MATNDDLDDFFKKKDRKGHKTKKQTGLLTNNEELLKQLVIVTSATTAFKENIDIDDDDEEYQANNDAVIGTGLADEQHKQPASTHHNSKTTANGQLSNLWDSSANAQQQQDEWEEFIDNSKYDQIRSKLGRTTDDYDDKDEFDDDRDDNDDNTNPNGNETNSTSDFSKDKPVWKISEIKQSNETQVPQVEDKVDEPPAAAKPAPAPAPAPTSTGAYRPPQLRGGTTGSVTVVSGIHNNQRTNKKKEPNLASTDEFPTLGATVNKK